MTTTVFVIGFVVGFGLSAWLYPDLHHWVAGEEPSSVARWLMSVLLALVVGLGLCDSYTREQENQAMRMAEVERARKYFKRKRKQRENKGDDHSMPLT